MHLGIIINIIAYQKQPVFGTFQWWRIPCSQDLLGWKECRSFFACKNINIGWTRNLSQILQLNGFLIIIIFLAFLYVRQVKVFDYKTHSPPLKFSNIRISYTLKVLCVANSDKNPKFSNYIHIVKLNCI